MSDELKAVDDVVDATMAKITQEALARAEIDSIDELNRILEEARVLASSYVAGLVTLDEVRRQSTPYERFLLARYVRPMPPEVKTLFDDLVDSDATQVDGFSYRTKHGLIAGHEIAGPLARMDRDDERGWRMRFASRWPWERRPKIDKHTGAVLDAGIRGEPIFAEDAKDRARLARPDEIAVARPRRTYRDEEDDE